MQNKFLRGTHIRAGPQPQAGAGPPARAGPTESVKISQQHKVVNFFVNTNVRRSTMQYFKLSKITGLIFSLTMFLAATQTAFAVGTASGTPITNTATVDYEVGTDPRSASGSDAGFVVDNRVDLTVFNTDAGNNVNVTPGQTNRVLTYTVTNTGNTTQGYLLTTATGTTNIPMGNVRIFLDDGGTPGSWDGTDTEYTGGTNAGDLDPNSVVPGADTMTIFIVADTPAGAVDTNTDDYRLVAQTTTLSSTTVITAAGAPTAGVDVVFADAAGDSDALRDGQHSDAATYTVTSPSLALVKTVVSTVDEFGTAFSIPNAVVNYQLRVTNSGAGTVDINTVSVTDPIPTGTKLCIAATAPCTAVPAFVDGATTSALSAAAFEYSIVAGGTACDNASFVGYAPVDGGDGADAAITCVRQQPTGTMAASGGTFDVRFYVIIE